MLDAKMKAEWDQGMAGMVELFPPFWKSLYDRCVEEGFLNEQAMEIVKVSVFCLAPKAGMIKLL